MKRLAFGLITVVVLAALSCSGAQSSEVQEPELPADGTSVLVQRDGVYIYDSIRPRPAAAVRHEMRLSGVTVTLLTPEGWTARRVGNGVWLDYGDTGAWFVIYPPRHDSHADSIREYHELDQRISHGVSELYSFDSDRQPYLYTIGRTEDGRSGLMYALLTEPGDDESGIVVTGIWPSTMDDDLRPVVVDAVNSVRLSRGQ